MSNQTIEDSLEILASLKANKTVPISFHGKAINFRRIEDMCNNVTECLQKYIPKRPKPAKRDALISAGWQWCCPSCGCAVGENALDCGEFTDHDDYCSSCGQRLNWDNII